MSNISIIGTGGGGGGSITINTTPIIGGTSPRVLYDNAGTVGEMSAFTNLSGSPNAATSYYCQSKPAIFVVASGSGDNWFEGEAGNFTVTGYQNFGTGTGALGAATSGNNNTAIGVNALGVLTTGFNNTALGQGALASTLDGQYNFAAGQNALGRMTTDYSNLAIGVNACGNQTISSNNFGNLGIGSFALEANVTTSLNVAIGISVLQHLTAGGGNTGIGSNCFQALTSGVQNTGIGQGIMQFATNGSFNIFIGQTCAQNISGGNNNIWFGTGYVGSAITYNNTFVLSLGSNTLTVDRNITAPNLWTFADYATPGLMTTNASGTISIANSAPAATTPASFSATNRIQLNIGGTTYYIPADTVAW